jgi:hypothetical protein
MHGQGKDARPPEADRQEGSGGPGVPGASNPDLEPDCLRASLDDESLTPGQRKRIAVFQSVEAPICARIEEMCGEGGIEVTDVAVLVVAPEARGIFFEGDAEPGVSVVLGHRRMVRDFLCAALPPLPDAPEDPYGDLGEEAPPRCVRVLVVDEEALTVLSYGTFVTVSVDPNRQAVA